MYHLSRRDLNTKPSLKEHNVILMSIVLSLVLLLFLRTTRGVIVIYFPYKKKILFYS